MRLAHASHPRKAPESPRGSAEAVADQRQALPVHFPARGNLIRIEDAISGKDAEQPAIRKRRRHVGAAARLTPRTCALRASPAGSVKSPRDPGRTAKIGRSGARPLATICRPSAKIGVGAMIFELPPSRHTSPRSRIAPANEVRGIAHEFRPNGLESYRVYRRALSERGWSPWDDPASTPRSCVSARSG
jgi:hypothetical protein